MKRSIAPASPTSSSHPGRKALGLAAGPVSESAAGNLCIPGETSSPRAVSARAPGTKASKKAKRECGGFALAFTDGASKKSARLGHPCFQRD